MDSELGRQAQLADVRAHLKTASAANDYGTVWRLLGEEPELERALSLIRGQETAVILDWQPTWETGAPLPQVGSWTKPLRKRLPLCPFSR